MYELAIGNITIDEMQSALHKVTALFNRCFPDANVLSGPEADQVYKNMSDNIERRRNN